MPSDLDALPEEKLQKWIAFLSIEAESVRIRTSTPPKHV